jgi:hypothetical protein
MKDITNVIDFGDLLSYAERNGIPWNKAHKILVDDYVIPMYEEKVRCWYIGELDQYDLSDESKKILIGFMEQNGVDHVNIII